MSDEEVVEHVLYHPDGNVAFRYSIKKWQYEGEFISFYPNGQIHEKRFYKNGQLDGEWITYYSNGDVQRKKMCQYIEPPEEYKDQPWMTPKLYYHSPWVQYDYTFGKLVFTPFKDIRFDK